MGGVARYGIIEGNALYEVQGDIFGQYSVGKRVASLEETRILPPVTPSKIVAVGKNYADHAKELDSEPPTEPIIFLKPPTAVIGHLDAIVYPPMSQRVDYEGELAVIIGKTTRGVEPRQAPEFILGYTCANDVTARDLQRRDGQWTRGKSFDTFLPLGPAIVTDLDPSDLHLQTRLNGQVKQDTSTRHLIFPVAHLVSFISQIMTLLPGDVILTGTPAGIGPMEPGDVVEVEIAGIGVLRNHVVTAS